MHRGFYDRSVSCRPLGSLDVVGVPVDLVVDPTLGRTAQGFHFGYYDIDAGVVAIADSPNQARVRRALFHELMHVADDALRIGLTHDQVRQLGHAFEAFLSNPNNIDVIRRLS